jgi:hypothetical protein
LNADAQHWTYLVGCVIPVRNQVEQLLRLHQTDPTDQHLGS